MYPSFNSLGWTLCIFKACIMYQLKYPYKKISENYLNFFTEFINIHSYKLTYKIRKKILAKHNDFITHKKYLDKASKKTPIDLSLKGNNTIFLSCFWSSTISWSRPFFSDSHFLLFVQHMWGLDGTPWHELNWYLENSTVKYKW